MANSIYTPFDRIGDEIKQAKVTQSEQLKRWKTVLNADTYSKLYIVCTSYNDSATDASQIVRGEQIYSKLKLIKDGFI